MADYPPYVNAYNSIPKLFTRIKTAAVPTESHAELLGVGAGLEFL
jgi:hypothetical protein